MDVDQTCGGVTDRESVVEAVVDAVATESGDEPFDLPPLWNVIDPEALESLFAPTKTCKRRAGRVVFEYEGYAVDVEVGQTVAVYLEDSGRGSIEN